MSDVIMNLEQGIELQRKFARGELINDNPYQKFSKDDINKLKREAQEALLQSVFSGANSLVNLRRELQEGEMLKLTINQVQGAEIADQDKEDVDYNGQTVTINNKYTLSQKTKFTVKDSQGKSHVLTGDQFRGDHQLAEMKDSNGKQIATLNPASKAYAMSPNFTNNQLLYFENGVFTTYGLDRLFNAPGELNQPTQHDVTLLKKDGIPKKTANAVTEEDKDKIIYHETLEMALYLMRLRENVRAVLKTKAPMIVMQEMFNIYYEGMQEDHKALMQQTLQKIVTEESTKLEKNYQVAFHPIRQKARDVGNHANVIIYDSEIVSDLQVLKSDDKFVSDNAQIVTYTMNGQTHSLYNIHVDMQFPYAGNILKFVSDAVVKGDGKLTVIGDANVNPVLLEHDGRAATRSNLFSRMIAQELGIINNVGGNSSPNDHVKEQSDLFIHGEIKDGQITFYNANGNVLGKEEKLATTSEKYDALLSTADANKGYLQQLCFPKYKTLKDAQDALEVEKDPKGKEFIQKKIEKLERWTEERENLKKIANGDQKKENLVFGVRNAIAYLMGRKTQILLKDGKSFDSIQSFFGANVAYESQYKDKKGNITLAGEQAALHREIYLSKIDAETLKEVLSEAKDSKGNTLMHALALTKGDCCMLGNTKFAFDETPQRCNSQFTQNSLEFLQKQLGSEKFYELMNIENKDGKIAYDFQSARLGTELGGAKGKEQVASIYKS